MADDKTTTSPPQNNEPPSDEQNAEESFWKRMDERLDAAIDRKVEQFRGTRDQRGSGHTTLTGFLADVMFGKQQPPADKK